ncbi:ubiquinone/menaquinone biosynthesis methyltransferase [Enteractinococcus coprophilus]|uniref:ubiquinone/menaquinone biosynthesis methyltransferase n=1 Tax=Enteractinococcus coprophilus TaxID=1027633 RepID=UPI001FE41FB0|nr:ubiquinone/menaquinone biosynthesis methyltransferase [Enteractinococcus coprophilus]
MTTHHAAVDAHGATVADMFDNIADRYDLMNLVMTWGQEPRFIRDTVDAVKLGPTPKVLDIATGTGDLAFEAANQRYGAEVHGLDISTQMLDVARTRPGGANIHWATGDAMDLPYADNTFDAVTHGYLLRNVTDIATTLAEQYRVLKPGGMMASLEMSPAPRNLVKPFSTAYIKYVVPRLANTITQNPDAYEYLSRTSRAFHTADRIEAMMQEAGFVATGYRSYMFGTMAIHWAQKPAE